MFQDSDQLKKHYDIPTDADGKIIAIEAKYFEQALRQEVKSVENGTWNLLWENCQHHRSLFKKVAEQAAEMEKLQRNLNMKSVSK